MIENLEPVDKMAAIVTSKPPEHCRFEHQTGNHHQQIRWAEFLKKQTEANQLDTPPPSWIPDKRGERHARLTVLGFADRHKANTGWKNFWIVRCDCGMLEVWSSKALNRNDPMSTMCRNCKEVQRIQWHASKGMTYVPVKSKKI
jgi:hypothetical protein